MIGVLWINTAAVEHFKDNWTLLNGTAKGSPSRILLIWSINTFNDLLFPPVGCSNQDGFTRNRAWFQHYLISNEGLLAMEPLAVASAVVSANANSYIVKCISSPGLDSMLLLRLSYPISQSTIIKRRVSETRMHSGTASNSTENILPYETPNQC